LTSVYLCDENHLDILVLLLEQGLGDLQASVGAAEDENRLAHCASVGWGVWTRTESGRQLGRVEVLFAVRFDARVHLGRRNSKDLQARKMLGKIDGDSEPAGDDREML